MRPEPFELNPANYGEPVLIHPRFGDLDVLGHVNNVMIGQLFEEGRMRYAIRTRQQSHEEMRSVARFVTASILTSYLGEVHYPAPVEVFTGMSRFGTCSYTLSSLMRQQGRVVAHSRVVVVHSAAGTPQPIPASVRAQYADQFIRRDA
jgi:acyl-CoA thioester hydrolase